MGALAAAEAVTSSSCRAMSPFPDPAISPFPNFLLGFAKKRKLQKKMTSTPEF